MWPDRSQKRRSVKHQNKRRTDSGVVVGFVMADQLAVADTLLDAVVVTVHCNHLVCCDYTIPHPALYIKHYLQFFLNQVGTKQPPPVSQGRRYHGNFDFSPRTTVRSFSHPHKWYISTITQRRRSVTSSGAFSVSDSLTFPRLQAAY